ncbi:MAG: hypothetical protein WBA93_15750 [Microcoleaceae cyanobacterium]
MPRQDPRSQRNSEAEIVYTSIGFNSPYREGTLRTIELVGVPGQIQKNGQCVVGAKTQRFFDELLVGKLFNLSIRQRSCNFQKLKIWLYDTNARWEEMEYQVPEVDNQDLLIGPNISSSKLKAIYVLDNRSVDTRLTGAEYQRWVRTAQELFTPLYMEFITPPEPPDILGNNPVVQFFQAVGENFDVHGRAKKKMLFDALIIQID